jgi:hypothetical protein
MNEDKEQLELEMNLHAAFDDIENSLKAIVLIAIDGPFPEKMAKKLVNSIVDAMEEAQKDTCETCPAKEECKVNMTTGPGTKFSSMRYDSLRATIERLMKDKPKIIKPNIDFSKKFMRGLK